MPLSLPGKQEKVEVLKDGLHRTGGYGKNCMHWECGPKCTFWICNKWTTGLTTENSNF